MITIQADWTTITVIVMASLAVAGALWRNHRRVTRLMTEMGFEMTEAEAEWTETFRKQEAEAEAAVEAISQESLTLTAAALKYQNHERDIYNEMLAAAVPAVYHQAKLHGETDGGPRAFALLYGLHKMGLWAPDTDDERMLAKAIAASKGWPALAAVEKLAAAAKLSE